MAEAAAATAVETAAMTAEVEMEKEKSFKDLTLVFCRRRRRGADVNAFGR